MSKIVQLISQNRLEEINDELDFEFMIHKILKDILNDELIDDYDNIAFEESRYSVEFIEGIEIFKALSKTKFKVETLLLSTVLVDLGYKSSEFVNRGITHSNEGFEIAAEHLLFQLRQSVQEFYDAMDGEFLLVPKANIAAIKTRISQALLDTISKSEFGYDMIQMAKSYEKIQEYKVAQSIYLTVVNDYESESVLLSSGLFPEISQFDYRSEQEILVYNEAKKLLHKLQNLQS